MHLATASKPPYPTSSGIIGASLYLAFFFSVVAFGQLYAYEQFPGLIESFNIPLLSDLSPVVAAVIVILEMLAIPFVLWMKVSTLMRLISFASAWFVLGFWLCIGLMQTQVDVVIPSPGIFGPQVMVPQGWGMVSFNTALIILLAYVTSQSLPLNLSATKVVSTHSSVTKK